MHKFQDWYGQVENGSLALPKQYIGQRHWNEAEINWIWKTNI